YTYTLDNANLNVQDLTTGESLTDTFTYTITDSDGDISTTTLTITINGADDGVELTVPTGQSVNESGLADGSNPNDSDIVDSSFTFKTLDGLLELVVGGTTLSKTQVEAITSSNTTTIDTGEGTLVLNGYSKAADGTITIDYEYTLKDNVDSTTITKDDISITVKDTDTTADTQTSILSIAIVDDTPTATLDTNSIKEDVASVTDNVFTNDTIGADTTSTPVTGVKAGSDTSADATSNVASDVIGTYGKVNIASDGSYTYTYNHINNNNKW
ncbi:VCBS domain-containing protein, partial [Malaciobacter pacificus]|uniref:VCBS domain-containing protein n=1 Tax=Malaciobacter pacificus TaxID=1080223 RepID=UPI00188884F1